MSSDNFVIPMTISSPTSPTSQNGQALHSYVSPPPPPTTTNGTTTTTNPSSMPTSHGRISLTNDIRANPGIQDNTNTSTIADTDNIDPDCNKPNSNRSSSSSLSISSSTSLSTPSTRPSSSQLSPTTHSSSFLRPGAVFIGRQSRIPSPHPIDPRETSHRRMDRYRHAVATSNSSFNSAMSASSRGLDGNNNNNHDQQHQHQHQHHHHHHHHHHHRHSLPHSTTFYSRRRSLPSSTLIASRPRSIATNNNSTASTTTGNGTQNFATSFLERRLDDSSLSHRSTFSSSSSSSSSASSSSNNTDNTTAATTASRAPLSNSILMDNERSSRSSPNRPASLSSRHFHSIVRMAHREVQNHHREQHLLQEMQQQQQRVQQLEQLLSYNNNNNNNNNNNRSCEEWQVRVIIQEVDIEKGTIKGSMQAINVPNSSKHVITSFEGEIVDFANHDLWTHRTSGYLAADRGVDLEYWGLVPAFAGVKDSDIINTNIKSWEARDMSSNYILMRWKERDFVNCQAHESGLTIQGYYYCCLSRKDGTIDAYYHDVSAAPYQKLSLSPSRPPSSTAVPFMSFDVL